MALLNIVASITMTTHVFRVQERCATLLFVRGDLAYEKWSEDGMMMSSRHHKNSDDISA